MSEKVKDEYILVISTINNKAGIVHSSICYARNKKELKFKNFGKEYNGKLIKSGKLSDLMKDDSIDINFVIHSSKILESTNNIQKPVEKVPAGTDDYFQSYVSPKLNKFKCFYYLIRSFWDPGTTKQ